MGKYIYSISIERDSSLSIVLELQQHPYDIFFSADGSICLEFPLRADLQSARNIRSGFNEWGHTHRACILKSMEIQQGSHRL